MSPPLQDLLRQLPGLPDEQHDHFLTQGFSPV